MDLEFSFEIHKNALVDTIRFYGNIDSLSERAFDELILQVAGRKVIMDFSTAGRINSMGIAILLRTIKNLKVEKKAEVSVIGENKTNAMLFTITGVYTLTNQNTPASS